MDTGGRVRNTYATYPLLEDTPEKFGTILHILIISHVKMRKGYGKGWACV